MPVIHNLTVSYADVVSSRPIRLPSANCGVLGNHLGLGRANFMRRCRTANYGVSDLESKGSTLDPIRF